MNQKILKLLIKILPQVIVSTLGATFKYYSTKKYEKRYKKDEDNYKKAKEDLEILQKEQVNNQENKDLASEIETKEKIIDELRAITVSHIVELIELINSAKVPEKEKVKLLNILEKYYFWTDSGIEKRLNNYDVKYLSEYTYYQQKESSN